MYLAVSAVVPAHKRPVELRAAIAAIREQDYPGPIDVVVVFDRAEPDLTLEIDGERPVRVLTNQRTPGLAGARNTGIVACSGELVAFCDDDDVWLPDKLSRQVALFATHIDAPMATTSIFIDYENRSTVRLAGTDTVTHAALLASRMPMLHSSTFLFRRKALEGPLGLISEEIPGSQGEDWDILLRSSALHPVIHLDEPLVRVLWGKSSHFSRRWDTKIQSSIWMLQNHPEMATHRKGSALLMGQLAFAYASDRQRRQAWSWGFRSLRHDPLQWRAWVSFAVALVPGSSDLVMNALHHWGRGV